MFFFSCSYNFTNSIKSCIKFNMVEMKNFSFMSYEIKKKEEVRTLVNANVVSYFFFFFLCIIHSFFFANIRVLFPLLTFIFSIICIISYFISLPKRMMACKCYPFFWRLHCINNIKWISGKEIIFFCSFANYFNCNC